MENSKKKEERKQRTSFKKQFKRLALIEFSKGKSANQVFNDLGIEIESNDKKYASKLIHKWRKEFYENLRLPTLPECILDKNLLLYETDLFFNNKEKDKIAIDFRKNIKTKNSSKTYNKFN